MSLLKTYANNVDRQLNFFTQYSPLTPPHPLPLGNNVLQNVPQTLIKE